MTKSIKKKYFLKYYRINNISVLQRKLLLRLTDCFQSVAGFNPLSKVNKVQDWTIGRIFATALWYGLRDGRIREC